MKTALSGFLICAALAAPLSLSAFDVGGAMNAASGMMSGSGKSESASSPLIDTLVSSLGVTSPQATGGTAALLNAAKGKMGADSFSSLLSSVPSLSSIMDGAGSLSGAGSLGSLTDQFSALGLSSDLIGPFTTKLLDFVQSESGTKMMNLLKGALL